MSESNEATKQVASNRRAFHEYAIVERLEAGLVLTGTEVKSVRINGCSLGDGYVRLRGGEAWLVNIDIAAYDRGTFFSQHEPRRDRKLLMQRREISRLHGQLQEKGLTLVPLRLYFRRGRVKVELGLGRGKKLYDKREAIKKRESQREVARLARRR
ncbi:MAG: SsrA-binding protein SmpB [Candidatus Eremiobacteraeota bacterium]|nr:SsrA-binding protein SmpB [Candidatus Eremiobacteraeota bacterium]MBC5826522.1 SsrA-binding protein SmpB [Candidatus Eremiobacteraeota bacterium]